MDDIIGSLERTRQRQRLSQGELATILQVTQGHYSKVINGKAALSTKLRGRIESWLATHQGTGDAFNETAFRMRELAASIQAQCIEFMQLSERLFGVEAS